MIFLLISGRTISMGKIDMFSKVTCCAVRCATIVFLLRKLQCATDAQSYGKGTFTPGSMYSGTKQQWRH